jgi:hypothetical protein
MQLEKAEAFLEVVLLWVDFLLMVALTVNMER